jgi:dihydrolipoamide dehydrogenase
MAQQQFDLVVIGGGPGGYVAAIRAAQLGKTVALVEENHLGGICLNWGCIPTKALLRTSEIYHTLHHLEEYGLAADNIRFDLGRVVARSRGVASQLAAGVKSLLKKNKITVFDGRGTLKGGRRIEVTKDGRLIAELASTHTILATGARARVLPGLEPDGKFIWTYKEAMIPTEMPKNLLVVGSGAIGIEFASFFNTLGAKVTVVEIQDRILLVEDEEISTIARKSFEKKGMTILTGAKVAKLEKIGDGVKAFIEQAGKITEQAFDRVIVAIGIVGNTENIGLETTKVKVERGQIVVDPYLQTGEPGLYAIGDVVGAPWLAHKASHEGIIAAEHLAGVKGVHAMDVRNIPGCTYSTPQIASVGLTEAKAKAEGYQLKVGRFPFIGNGKAIALGEPEGIIKTVFDAKTGELLGAHMIGPEVTELIQGYTIARTLEATEAELIATIFPHPTLSEAMHESVLDAFGRAIHF